jgi:hypothetical protein
MEINCESHNRASTVGGIRSSGRDKARRDWITCLGAALDQNTTSLAVFQRIDSTAHTTQPEMLNGMSVQGFFADRTVLMEAEQSALSIVKGRLTIRVSANRKHKS